MPLRHSGLPTSHNSVSLLSLRCGSFISHHGRSPKHPSYAPRVDSSHKQVPWRGCLRVSLPNRVCRRSNRAHAHPLSPLSNHGDPSIVQQHLHEAPVASSGKQLTLRQRLVFPCHRLCNSSMAMPLRFLHTTEYPPPMTRQPFRTTTTTVVLEFSLIHP